MKRKKLKKAAKRLKKLYKQRDKYSFVECGVDQTMWNAYTGDIQKTIRDNCERIIKFILKTI